MNNVIELETARLNLEAREVTRARALEEATLDAIEQRLLRIERELAGLDNELYLIQTARGGLDPQVPRAHEELRYFTLDLWMSLGEKWDWLPPAYVEKKRTSWYAWKGSVWDPQGYQWTGNRWEYQAYQN